MKAFDGTTVDLDIDEDIEEDGGVESEAVILEWFEGQLASGDATGFTAAEIAEKTEITEEEARGRLINLWENDLLSCEDEGDDKGVNGRFFLVTQ